MVSFLLTVLSQRQRAAFRTMAAVMASGLFDVEETGGHWDHNRFRDASLCPCILAGDGSETNLARVLAGLVAEIPRKADPTFIFAARGDPIVTR